MAGDTADQIRACDLAPFRPVTLALDNDSRRARGIREIPDGATDILVRLSRVQRGGRAADQAAICARVLQPSLSMMCCTWVSTVRTEMTRLAAIWLLDCPLGHQRRHVPLPAGQLARTRPGGRPASGRGRADSPRANAMASVWSIALPLRERRPVFGVGQSRPGRLERRIMMRAERGRQRGRDGRPRRVGRRWPGSAARVASRRAAAIQASASRHEATPDRRHPCRAHGAKRGAHQPAAPS